MGDPALAQSEALVPFTDIPENFPTITAADRRIIDIRKIDGPFTPKDQFFTTQHYGHPEVDPATFRLRISGLVDRPTSLSLDELRKMGGTELVAGFECSGNRRPLQGLSGNGRWTGVPLRMVLEKAGVKAQAREFVFFGADHGTEDVDFRGQNNKVEQNFGRSLSREKALSAEPFLAYALNGEPLTRHQGSPLRLIGSGMVRRGQREMALANPRPGGTVPREVPGALVPHLAGRDDRRRDEVGRGRGYSHAVEVVHRTRHPRRQPAQGVRRRAERWDAAEVGRSPRGRWPVATGDDGSVHERQIFLEAVHLCAWNGATPGEHTLVSRVTDVNGKVQPTSEELENKKTFLEDNSQFPRKVMIS